MSCRLLRPEGPAELRVEVSVSRDGFEWATSEDQLSCSGGGDYPDAVAAVLRDALSGGCALCEGRGLHFRLFLLNEPVGGRAQAMSLILLSPDPQESPRTLAELSALLSQSPLPPIPRRRPRCTLEVSITPPRLP